MPISLEWNPTLDHDCSGLYVDWYFCIGIQAQTSASFEYLTTTPPLIVPNKTEDYTPTTFPTVDPNFDPTPTQAGLATDCQDFYKAQDVSAFTQTRPIPLVRGGFIQG